MSFNQNYKLRVTPYHEDDEEIMYSTRENFRENFLDFENLNSKQNYMFVAVILALILICIFVFN
ncbi:002R [Cherax quadricarinatus iridovirus]|uniref:002R n=1 Tax=Cherax quadricarinatus iridovirus TaxID=2035708 RepID=UPI000BBF44FF|nr:002R [Cherax quadricarinatus iridovirus]ASZ84982.1 002R [Cherax quadricarinatus iridovirus]